MCRSTTAVFALLFSIPRAKAAVKTWPENASYICVRVPVLLKNQDMGPEFPREHGNFLSPAESIRSYIYVVYILRLHTNRRQSASLAFCTMPQEIWLPLVS